MRVGDLSDGFKGVFCHDWLALESVDAYAEWK